jgi:hypothetical protein
VWVFRSGVIVDEAPLDRVTTTGQGLSTPHRYVAPFLYAVAAAIFIAIRFVTNGTLGFHIDELYYMESGRHLSFG